MFDMYAEVVYSINIAIFTNSIHYINYRFVNIARSIHSRGESNSDINNAFDKMPTINTRKRHLNYV